MSTVTLTTVEVLGAPMFMTGKVQWRRDGGGQGGGSACVTYADGRLYYRYQDGVMALVDASPQGGFRQISSL